jgi:hypothetical protein
MKTIKTYFKKMVDDPSEFQAWVILLFLISCWMTTAICIIGWFANR